MKQVSKYIIIIALLFGALHTLSAQTLGKSEIRERTYISTDKNCYVAGDNVWCSVYCFDVTSGERKLSSFSSVAYLELHSTAGMALRAKVALVNGRGAGTIVLPSSLLTGNYALIVYTKQNKNEEGFKPEAKMLTVFNVFSPDRLENVSIEKEATAQNSNKPIITGKNSGISLSFLSDTPTHKSSPLKIRLNNESGEEIYCNISIYHDDSLSFLPNTTIGDFFSKIESQPKGEVSQTFIPDYEGEQIEFKLNNIKESDREAFSNSKLFISSNDLDGNIYSSSIGEDGKVNFFTGNIFGQKDLVCELFPADSTFSLDLELVSPFLAKYDGDIPHLTYNSSISKRLEKKGTMMQIERRFGGDTLYTLFSKRPNILFGDNYQRFLLDNYTRFATIEEVVVEFITGIRIRKSPQGKVDFRVLMTPFNLPAYYSNESSLMLMDGVPIFNHKKIFDYDPLLLKEIVIYPEPYLIDNYKYEGIVSFNTYKGDLPFIKFGNNVKILQFEGALIPYSFTGEKIFNKKNYPDYRQTIYWHPSVSISQKETLEFDCYTPMYNGNFIVVVEGVTASGEPIHYQSGFKVR